jgi:L-alanine-DL-glutamate epimerase-like enolase superfamily enzyme
LRVDLQHNFSQHCRLITTQTARHMTDTTITAIRITMLRVPWPQTEWLKGHAFGPTREFLVLDVETRGGLTGMGYLFLFRPGMRTIATCLDECVIPRVIGKDASAVEAIWQDLWNATVTYGRAGIAVMAMSILDIALWDVLGKAAKLPLHRLWGHYRAQLPAYGSGCFRGSGGDGMIAKALHYKERGYQAIKMQVAHTADLATDLDNVRRMREAVRPDIEIMIDVNMGWTADIAIQMGRKFEDYNVYWLEEPVVPDDFAGYLRVAEALDLRVVGGETHFTRFDLKPFFENPRLPILQPDPMRGGLTELRKIATVADTWGMTIAPHLFPELNASIPNGLWIEDMGLADDIWVDPVPVVKGVITAPERPGHGLAFKPEILRDCAVKE